MSKSDAALTAAERLLYAGKINDARQACMSALQSEPGNARAHFILSEAELRGGRIGAALDSARRSRAHRPTQPEYAVQVAKCLAIGGQTKAALVEARYAASIRTQDPRLMSNLASVFGICEKYDEAAPLYKSAARLDPNNGEYFYNLAVAQRALGDLADAEASCDTAIALNRRDCMAHYVRSDLRRQTADRNHVEALRNLLQEGNAAPAHRVLLCYALAKELEDLQRYEESYAALKTGADLFRASIQYNVRNDVAVIDEIIAAQAPSGLADRAASQTSSPVFIVGLPRSGTTLIERIVQSHSEMLSVGEKTDFPSLVSAMARALAGTSAPSAADMVRNSLQIDVDRLGRMYLDRVSPESIGARRTVDKLPINYLYCGLIHAAFPRAKIISVRRGAMDSCYSAYKAYLTGPYPFSYTLREMGEYYVAYDRLMAHWRRSLPPDSYLEVRYEDVVANVEQQARGILNFLQVPWEDGVLRFHENAGSSSTASAAQVRQPVYSTSVGRWRHYKKHLADLESVLRNAGLLQP